MTNTEKIEINPSQPSLGTIIWLHGLGADGHDFVPIASELNLPLRFVFPHAPERPITINNGYVMRAWFDIHSLNDLLKIDRVGIEESVQFVEKLIENEIKQGVPSNKIVLAGFSQGAAIALSTGLRYPRALAGMIALSGYLPLTDTILTNAHSANTTTPIFLAHGTEDRVLPYSLGTVLCETLQKKHYPVEWHSYVMPHSVCPQEIVDIRHWLAKIYFYEV